MSNHEVEKELTLDDIIGKEVSAELLKEMNITTIEEYRRVFQEDSKKGKGNGGNKNSAKQKISNSKRKQEMRKKEMLVNKKIKNEMRSKILESLERHNKEESALLEELYSAKNLGRKRKKSKDIPFKEEKNEEEEAEEYEEKEKISVEGVNLNADVEMESESEGNQVEVKQDKNTTTIENKPGSFKLDSKTRESIIEEIKKHREKEEVLLSTSELDEENIQIDNSNLNLTIPDRSNVIVVDRVESIQADRLNLPIVKYEHEIMDKINNSLVTVVCGETGSGKSTQIPQFLYEYGYTKSLGGIVITQPRRVAAVSLATRVSEELNTKLGEEVGYQVRYDSKNISENTVVKYVTDGILLKELENDQLLLKYSVIIIDEAHERTINTDIIIGLLSRLVRMRYLLSKNKVRLNRSNCGLNNIVHPLRLVIMSATMRVDEFLSSQVFRPHIVPSFIKVEARQYPVTVHHAKRTLPDYMEEAFKLVCKIHMKLPAGGILVFLTGKKEINFLCSKLKAEFENGIGKEEGRDMEEFEEGVFDIPEVKKEEEVKVESENKEEEKVDNTPITIEEPSKRNYKPYVILPLYSSLPQDQQVKVFSHLPEDKRMIVIATNVAETSLTIPNVRYVVDTGRAKKRVFTHGLSFSTFRIEWISQASAEQRTGRAGRTGPGFCYRLYSNGLYSKMDRYTEPQILSCPLDQTILYLKSLNITDVSKFPFLTFPSRMFVEKALRHLLVLGALKSDDETDMIKNYISACGLNKDNVEAKIDYKDNTTITELGKLMVKFPLPPKYSKIIILANKFKLLEHSIILSGLMNVESIFSFENSNSGEEEKNKNEKIKNKFDLRNIIDSKMICPQSDALTLLNLIIALLKVDPNRNQSLLYSFCKKYCLNVKRVKEMIDLIEQLLRISKIVFTTASDEKKVLINPNSNIKSLTHNLEYPSTCQQNLLMQILLSGFIDNLSRRKVIYDKVGNIAEESQIKNKKVIYECNENNEECHIHPHSVIAKSNADLVIYKEILQETGNNNKSKAFLICNTIIKPEWIYNLGGHLVSYSLINNSMLNEPFYNKMDDAVNCFVNIKYGYKSWDLPRVRVEMNKEEENYLRFFARFLLEGKIFVEFAEFEKYLNSKPSIITNQVSLFPKVTMLVNSLRFSKIKIRGREDLRANWRERKNFLLDAYLNWFDDRGIKEKIKKKWPLVK